MAKVPIKWSEDWPQLTYTSWAGTTLRIPSQNHILTEEYWVTETDIKSYVVPQVNNTPVAYIPTATGNTLNLNEFIIDSGGSDKWFVDFFGNAMKVYESPAAGTVTIRRNSGANVGTRPRINFIEGPNITLTVIDDGADNEVDVTIEAVGSAGGYDTIQQAGTPLTQRTILNFAGFGITAVDDGAGTRTTVTLASTLQNLSLLPGNGYVVQTSATSFANRSITAGSSKVTIGNGDGVAGNTTVDIVEANININNLGFGPLTYINGGTGLSTLGTANQVLGVNGSGTAMEYKTVTGSGGITINHTAGGIEIAGSGASSYQTVQVNGSAFTQRSIINFIGSTFSGADNISRTNVSISAIINSITDLATTGYISRTGSGTTAARTFTAGSTRISITNGDGVSGNTTIDAIEANFNLNNISGTLQINKGGTALTALGTANQYLAVNTLGNALVYKTFVAGTGISISHVGTNTTITATGGTGTVTSVGLAAHSHFIVSGSPVTTSGTLNFTWANQSANLVLAGPTSSTAQPAFRFLVENDIPVLTATTKLQMNTARILGRTTGGFGLVQELTIGAGLLLSAGSLSATTLGTVTSVGVSSTDLSVSGSPVTSSGTITLNINNDAVTFAKMQNIAQGRIMGRYSAGTGDPQVLTLGTGLAMDVSLGILSATGASNWTLSSGLLYPNSTATNVAIGNTSSPSASYKFYVNGLSYLSGETQIGGVLSTGASGRGTLSVRMADAGIQGGMTLHSSSGSAHGITSMWNAAIWGKIQQSTNGGTLSFIGNNPVVECLRIEGISDFTGTAKAGVVFAGSRRTGTSLTTISDNGVVMMVENFTTGRFYVMGNGEVQANSTYAWLPPRGTTAQRPASPIGGHFRFNTTTSKLEVWTGAAWVDLH